jgi:nucleotide-binding universal stress UspA family protein
MKNNILLPTDFSENAWSATEYATKLFANEDCNFYFLHASQPPSGRISVSSTKLARVMADNDLKSLSEFKAKAENTFPNSKHKFNILLSQNDLFDAIEVTISQHGIDLVIMGTKGASRSEDLFFGSNTVNVIKRIKSSAVLMIPDGFNFVKPKQIAFPTDFNRSYGKEIEYVKQMCGLYKSKISVVHISDNLELSEAQHEQQKALESVLEHIPHSFNSVLDSGKKEHAIKDFIEEHDIDILAMIYYTHSFLEYVIKEPVIKRIGFHPTIPFLVIPKA